MEVTANLIRLKNTAALELSNALGIEFDIGRSAVSFFTGETTEADLYHLRIDQDGVVESTKARNILYNLEDITHIDFAEAVSHVVEFLSSPDDAEALLVVIQGGLFLAGRLQELAKIELSLEDSAIVVALHGYVGASESGVELEHLLPKWKEVLERSKLPAQNANKKTLKARLDYLSEIKVVFIRGKKWHLAEKVVSLS